MRRKIEVVIDEFILEAQSNLPSFVIRTDTLVTIR